MDKRNIITEVLKSWYIIDSVLLNDHAKNTFTKGSDFKEWTSLKAAMLSNLYEYYMYVGFTPNGDTKYANDKVLQESAVSTSIKGKALAATMIKKDEFKASIKNHITEAVRTQDVKDVRAFSDKVIRERFSRMTLDNVLIGLPLLESKTPNKAKDFKGEILEESYRMMRNSLIHLSKTANRSG
tara:strand:+ start:323 stop:871 length:549 start_codon:yes stop_codon:yes gene_type:complete